METRKIQSIGGSSFSLVLPKKWVEGQHLKDKDEVAIDEQKSGRLVLTPMAKKVFHRKKVSIAALEGEELYREVIVLYILGLEEVELTAQPISRQQKLVIRGVMQKLAGMEIIEESSTSVLLRNFLDPKKFSFAEYLSKIFLMSRLMFTDSINAFLRHNKDLALDVIERDFEVDKITFLISRMKHSLMLGSVSEEELDAGLVEADYYDNIAKQLERIADHAVKIAGLARAAAMPKNAKMEKVLQTGSDRIIYFLEEAERFAKAVDKKTANKVLLEISKSSPHTEPAYAEIAKIGHGPGLILSDSLDRISGYIVNMAEHTLAQAALKVD